MNTLSQLEIESLYSKRSIHTVLHETINYELDKLLLNWASRAYMAIPELIDGNYYASKNERMLKLQEYIAEVGLNQLVVEIAAAVLHTHEDQTIQQVIGYLSSYLPYDDVFDAAKTAGELLAVCSSKKGLYSIKRVGPRKILVKVRHWPFLDARILDQFDWINDTTFNPPLVERPLRVTDNSSCGYHGINEPLILGRLTQHNFHQNKKPVNLLNGIEWVLDPEVLKMDERPSKPIEDAEQYQQYAEMVQASAHVYSLLHDRHFYLAWQYDSRGRIYSHGYHVNFQSAEYKKALLSFNTYELLT